MLFRYFCVKLVVRKVRKVRYSSRMSAGFSLIVIGDFFFGRCRP